MIPDSWFDSVANHDYRFEMSEHICETSSYRSVVPCLKKFRWTIRESILIFFQTCSYRPADTGMKHECTSLSFKSIPTRNVSNAWFSGFFFYLLHLYLTLKFDQEINSFFTVIKLQINISLPSMRGSRIFFSKRGVGPRGILVIVICVCVWGGGGGQGLFR